MTEADILLIEDDHDMCDELKEILVGEGFSVDLAYDGAEGLDAINKNKYRLILLDLKLPRVDGRAILKYIKSKGIDVRVIVVTAYATNVPDARAVGGEVLDSTLQMADSVWRS